MFRFIFYPGVIMHEFSHAIVCLLSGTKISKISFGLKESYVKHEQVGPIRMSLIALAPFYIGFILGIALFFLAKNVFLPKLIWFILVNYFGICIIYNSIPSAQDTKNINNAIEDQIKKDWKKKGVSSKLFVILKIPILYFPIFLCGQLVSIFDKFELIRALYVIFIFASVYGVL